MSSTTEEAVNSQPPPDWVPPEEADLYPTWKEVALVGAELDYPRPVDIEPWFFPHLDEELQRGILAQDKPIIFVLYDGRNQPENGTDH